MTGKEKQSIAQQLAAYCAQKGSQNKAARSLRGVSPGTVSQMLSGNWDLISDEMWRNVASQTGRGAGEWSVTKTRAWRRMTSVLEDARCGSMVFAVIGDAGCGKTEAVRGYTSSHADVYHLCCSEFWNRRHFMAELLRSLGAESGGTVTEMMADAVQILKRKERPLVILDEADKLSDQVLYFFISLYNALEDRCGIVLTATDYLEKRIRRGVRSSRKGYREIYSRVGRKFIALPLPDSTDIREVCEANGVTDSRTIRRITDECDNDLRRVRRLVYAVKLDGGDGEGDQ